MKRIVLLSAVFSFALSLAAATSPKDEVAAAAKKLGEQANYSWKQTVETGQFTGVTDGKTEKDGFTHLVTSFGDNRSETVLQGGKGAVTNQDGAWESLAEAETAEGFGRFRAIMARNFKAPAAQAAELAAAAKELKKDGDAYSGELTEEGAKPFLRFGRGGDASVKNAKGSVKFWVKDGMLSKYEYRVSGTVSFNDNDRDVDRTTTVEIKDVGSTKVAVPDAAKKKLSS